MRGGLAGAALVLTVLLAAVGCGGDDSDSFDSELRVFAAGAPEGLRASLDAFTEQTGIPVRLTSSGDFVNDLRKRIGDDDPPDVALIPQPAFLSELARDGEVVPLSPDVLAAVEENFSEPIQEIGEVDGDQYGILTVANAKSIVWYRPDQFAENGYEVPETWDELTALTDQMRDDGVTPWCFGTRTVGGVSGWSATDWIEDFVLHTAGGEVYDAWVEGTIGFDDPRIETAFELFDEIVVKPGQTRGGPSTILSTLWDEAGDPLLADPPECFLSHNASFWAGSLPAGTSIGSDGDIDVFPFPVLDEQIGSVDVVGGDIAAALTDREEAMALMEYFATPASGEPWAAEGGYLSPHLEFDIDAYADPFDRRLAEIARAAPTVRFDGSDEMPVAVGERSFRLGMESFIRTRNFDRSVAIIERGYAVDSED